VTSWDAASNASGHAGPPGPGAGSRSAPGPLSTVFVTVAVRTSDGPGPGVKQVPAAEAGALVAQKHAVYGDQPPRGWCGAA
jgi:hypothetical protein